MASLTGTSNSNLNSGTANIDPPAPVRPTITPINNSTIILIALPLDSRTDLSKQGALEKYLERNS